MKKGPTVAEVQNAIDTSWEDDASKSTEYTPPFASYSVVTDDFRRHIKPCVGHTFVLGDVDNDVQAYAVVHLNGNMKSYYVAGWQVTLVTQDAALAQKLNASSVGDAGMLDGEIVLSIDGGPLFTYQEAIRVRELQQQRIKQESESAAKAFALEQAKIKAEEARRVEQQRQKQIQLEQELQEARRLRQEQVNKQREAARQKQQTVDKYATQYERSTEPFAYEQAVIQLKAIKYHIEEGASSQIILERAAVLRSRCMKSRDALPSSSAQASAPDGEGATVGAIIGGVLGILGGLPGIALGAVAGGLIGRMSDQPSSSPEQKQWAALVQDIDELVSKMLE